MVLLTQVPGLALALGKAFATWDNVGPIRIVVDWAYADYPSLSRLTRNQRILGLAGEYCGEGSETLVLAMPVDNDSWKLVETTLHSSGRRGHRLGALVLSACRTLGLAGGTIFGLDHGMDPTLADTGFFTSEERCTEALFAERLYAQEGQDVPAGQVDLVDEVTFLLAELASNATPAPTRVEVRLRGLPASSLLERCDAIGSVHLD